VKPRSTFVATALASLLLSSVPAHGQGWPEIFDPLVLRTINLQMSNADWQTIQNDETFDIEVPTMLWLDGEAPILVSIRRKSADPLTNAPGYAKVSYKIDINELVSGQNWHGLRAVSLDNGDDQDVVSEGLAWYLHRQASGPEGYGYNAGLASWVRLVINGVDTGVYVNAEQRDKRFLENRGLWVNGGTWLYEVEDLNGFELDEGGPGDSPTFTTLCYSPFASPSSCATPDPATLAAVLPGLVNMQGLLAMAAVDTFTGNPDAIFSHGKNFYFADYLSGSPRLHFPWDLDSAMGGGGLDDDIYAADSSYSTILLAVPQFRAQYTQILTNLACGPFQLSDLHAFIDALEPVLSSALAADPNNQIGGSVSSFFAGRKAWIAQRRANVISQLENFVPCNPHLFVDPLASGTTVDFTVTGAHSGETVFFGFSLTGVGAGPCFVELGGICLDLLEPIELLGVDDADTSGTAVLQFALPPGLPPITVSFQAVIPRGPANADTVKSNAVTRTIF
jgi:CotH kinase protein